MMTAFLHARTCKSHLFTAMLLQLLARARQVFGTSVRLGVIRRSIRKLGSGDPMAKSL